MKDEKEGLKVYHARSPLPAQLPELPALFSRAQAAGLKLTVLTHAASGEGERVVAKRRHDFAAALRTLGFTVEALQNGYTFQDDKGPAKIEAIAKAVAIVEREAALVAQLLAGQ